MSAADGPPASSHHLGTDSIVSCASLCFQTADLSRAGLCLFHLLPQHEAQSLEPRVIRECLLTGEAETGENICSSDPRRSAGTELPSRRNILPGRAPAPRSPRSRRQLRRAWQREGLVSAWKMRSLTRLPVPPEPLAHSLFNEMFSNVLPGNWRGGFFLPPLFLPGPGAWLPQLSQQAGSKVPGGKAGLPLKCQLLWACPALPMIWPTVTTTALHCPVTGATEQGWALSSGAQRPWLLHRAILSSSALSFACTCAQAIPFPGEVQFHQETHRDSFFVPTICQWRL